MKMGSCLGVEQFSTHCLAFPPIPSPSYTKSTIDVALKLFRSFLGLQYPVRLSLVPHGCVPQAPIPCLPRLQCLLALASSHPLTDTMDNVGPIDVRPRRTLCVPSRSGFASNVPVSALSLRATTGSSVTKETQGSMKHTGNTKPQQNKKGGK